MLIVDFDVCFFLSVEIDHFGNMSVEIDLGPSCKSCYFLGIFREEIKQLFEFMLKM